jgi:hypothetical protein
MSRQKKAVKVVGAIAAFCVLAAGVGLLQRRGFVESRFSCRNPDYNRISVGMSKEEVVNLLGKSHQTRINLPGGKNFIGQGLNTSNLTEAWIFNFLLWSGSIEIYFDGNGKVAGRNCGYG